MPPRKCLSLSLSLLALLLFAVEAKAEPDPGSQLIECDRADEPITISTSSHLDPSCTWSRGVEIVASNVTLDCQGAHIATTDRRIGVLITAPATVALSNITVRNCHIEGFLNNVRITRDGFRELAEGAEYENAYSDIVIEDSTIKSSRGVGIFVDGYVTGVTLRNLHVEGAGSTGIYLEAGSKDNLVEHNEIVNNGFGENGPAGQPFQFGGVDFWFWGTGREGLAIDGSRFNTVRNNHFSGNAAGGIFLYKNCGEFVNERPERWWHRRYGADGNLIEGNTFEGGSTGVWIASRMGENTLPMDCSDPAYFTGAIERVVLDYADDNVVRGNTFDGVIYGVRVEDDDNVIEDNEFTSDDPAHQAVLLGTRFRTPKLGQPVEGTIVRGNRAQIAGNGNPYRWIHGHANTTFEDNEALGRPAGLCEGVQPRTNTFIFVLAFQVYDPENPPTGGPPEIPPPEPLPPCPLACSASGDVDGARLVFTRLNTPPGDDTLVFRGEVTVPHPFQPALDPVETGVGIVVTDATGTRVVDLRIPGGAYDPETRIGWKTARKGGRWKYVNKSGAPDGGITTVVIKDLEKREPGLVRFTVEGRRGDYAVDWRKLPLEGVLALDPPTAETGQCAVATFSGPKQRCRSGGGAVRCK